jgi:GxxExxY protein
MEKELLVQVTEAAIEVHGLLGGPGLLETIYEAALCYELSLRGFRTQRQLPIPVTYKNTTIRDPLYLDILLENKLIIEVKATGKDYPFYQAQLLTYLRLMKIRSGLLIDFGRKSVKEGILTVINEGAATHGI